MLYRLVLTPLDVPSQESHRAGTNVSAINVAPDTPAAIVIANGGQKLPPLSRSGKKPTTVVAVVASTWRVHSTIVSTAAD